ncbi:cell division protein ZapA [Stutzerimonas kirkiae]|uniref:Cell division protein ZapA n=1 Tax=Stutzerimonas kirkiae TaxID=2211392 RepID=A0A4Q9R1P4_9GAMM|nr:cell division protein ZapA [Stutzerimonas kirkiae]TBU92816.1 cell division protein ZapA [Stutzerimonas kirkiae]TBV01279.1 cell division protein ZapA [Stutzerimonas kirkiae]TBV10738.1 cell division protein ZapA [Stutzerimonas kirkiae]TBV14530.1 cell division protein ZapA [Stutzerimonas kirkiae]
MSDVRVLNILGRDYSIRACAEEEVVLAQAMQLLQVRVQESQQRFPHASHQELLVMTALNLCVPLIQQEQRLAASLERINRQLVDLP